MSQLLIDAYGTIEPVDVGAMEATFKRIESDPRVRLQGSHWAALINAYGCVMKDTDKAISVFESISSHPSSQRSPTPLPDAVSYESLINVLVTRKRMDLAQQYLARLQATGVHMTAYIANLLIKGYAADGAIEQARAIFESLADPASGVAAPGNHVPHDSASSAPPLPPDSISYREVRLLMHACLPPHYSSHPFASLRRGKPCSVQNLEMVTVIAPSPSSNGYNSGTSPGVLVHTLS